MFIPMVNARFRHIRCLVEFLPHPPFRRSFFTTQIFYKKRKNAEEKKAPRAIYYPPKSTKAIVPVWRNISVQDLASSVGKSNAELFEALSFVNEGNRYKSPKAVIDDPSVVLEVVRKFGARCKMVANPEASSEDKKVSRDAEPRPAAPPDDLQPRPPVVAVMGHVDHGKTSLLDAIRNTRVVESEFGGITQHIGAFTVTISSGEKMTFLDTPGHAAFSTMRERGANVTDIVLLVVAADDGVMEQTVQSIRMANNAKVAMIVVINKIDKPTADIERTKKMLATHGVQVEDLGGDVQAVPVSAVTGQGLSQLVDAIAVQAEVMDLKADYRGLIEGIVLESRTDPSRGKLSTIIIKRGTLRKGSYLVAGTAWAKVRAMFDDQGSTMEAAIPGTPVQIIGWRELPGVGELVLEVETERRANEVVRWRQQHLVEQKIENDLLEIKKKEEEHQLHYKAQLEAKRKLGKFKVRPSGPRKKEIDWDSSEPRVHIIIKGDVAGSVEAILDVLSTYDCSHECKLDVVHYGVGAISENDVELASAFNAIVYAFNTDVLPIITKLAKDNSVIIKKENVIYRLIDDLRQVISSRLIPKKIEETIELWRKTVTIVLGEAKVQQIFMVNEGKKKIPVAGSRCVKGELKKDALYKILREGEVVLRGQLVSMRHMKNEVGTVKKDVECGLMFEEGPPLLPGDVVVCYKMVDQPQSTSWDPGF